jgi:hypothetical protein
MCLKQDAIVSQGSDIYGTQREPGPAGIDTSVPHSARIYDYRLGGKDNSAADRAMAEAFIAAIPTIRTMAAENRKFVHRAAR